MSMSTEQRRMVPHEITAKLAASMARKTESITVRWRRPLFVLLLNLKLSLGEGKNRKCNAVMAGGEPFQWRDVNRYPVMFTFGVGPRSIDPAVVPIHKFDECRLRFRCLWETSIQVDF